MKNRCQKCGMIKKTTFKCCKCGKIVCLNCFEFAKSGGICVDCEVQEFNSVYSRMIENYEYQDLLKAMEEHNIIIG